jgi:hypothetical protein
MHDFSVWIGWEPREAAAYAVAAYSCETRARHPIDMHGVVLSKLRADGLYTRTHSRKGAQIWDDISDAPMSTEFACSRFLVPHLAKNSECRGFALFVDCDMLFRRDVFELFDLCDPGKAVMVVKHDHQPVDGIKMDNQIQTRYNRKNWSSVCAFNLDHPANAKLTVEMVNTLPGRDLHRLCWLRDDQIGELDCEWNWLVGHSEPRENPGIVHFTDGIPLMAGYENCAYADEWRAELNSWAASI